MDTSQVLMMIGGFLSAIVIALLVVVYRIYKHVGRRCQVCGEMKKNYHVSKIIFPNNLLFHPHTVWTQFVELIHNLNKEGITKFRKEFHWWIRGVQLVTFSVCPSCKGGEKRIRVVTISNRPISLWHLCWVWYRDREQFTLTFETHYVYRVYIRLLYREEGEKCAEEPPPFKLTFED